MLGLMPTIRPRILVAFGSWMWFLWSGYKTGGLGVSIDARDTSGCTLQNAALNNGSCSIWGQHTSRFNAIGTNSVKVHFSVRSPFQGLSSLSLRRSRLSSAMFQNGSIKTAWGAWFQFALDLHGLALVIAISMQSPISERQSFGCRQFWNAEHSLCEWHRCSYNIVCLSSKQCLESCRVDVSLRLHSALRSQWPLWLWRLWRVRPSRNASWDWLSPGRQFCFCGLCWTGRGNHFCSASDDKSIWIWNTETQKLLNKCPGHNNYIFSVKKQPPWWHACEPRVPFVWQFKRLGIGKIRQNSPHLGCVYRRQSGGDSSPWRSRHLRLCESWRIFQCLWILWRLVSCLEICKTNVGWVLLWESLRTDLERHVYTKWTLSAHLDAQRLYHPAQIISSRNGKKDVSALFVA